jgi:hypothetical protein
MDARTLVVQVVRNRQADLLLFDLRTRRFHEPPRGGNTRAWEWHGSISGRSLLFGRFNGVNGYDIVLTDLRTGREHILDSVRGHGAYAEPGQVNAGYAVWAGCPDNFCTVYRYNIRTRAVIRVPGDYKHVQYRSAVSANGDVYYGRGLYSCGGQVKLMRYRPGEPPIVLTTLPRGYDFRFMNTDGRRVLYDRGRCSGGGSDIYSVETH